MRTKVFGIIVGVAVLHMVLLLALVGTSGCANESVMAGRAVRPPVEDNVAPIANTWDVGAPVTPIAPLPAERFNNAAAKPAATVAARAAALPKLDLPKGSNTPVKSAAVGAAAGSYKVVSGDTLGGIAHRHGVKTADLAALNGMDLKAVLRIGQTLQIPAGGKKVAAAPKATKKAAEKGAAAATVTAAGGTYAVVKGDFPAKIAKKHGVSTAALLQANNLTESSVLQIGQKLVIPGKGAVATTEPKPNVPAKTPANNAISTSDLDDIVDDLPTTAPITPAVTPGTTPAVTPVVAPVTPGTTPAVTPATTPVVAPVAVDLEPMMVDRDQPLKDFAARFGVTEDEIRRHNAAVIPADNILKQKTIIMLPAVKK